MDQNLEEATNVVNAKLEEYSVSKMTPESQVIYFKAIIQKTVLDSLVNGDGVYQIGVHTNFLAAFRQALASCELPTSYEDPYGVSFDDANAAFKEYCSNLQVSEMETSQIAPLTAKVLAALPPEELFVKIVTNTARINFLTEQFLINSGAANKLARAGLPFDPSAGEKRILAMLVALLAPERGPEDQSVLIGNALG